MMGKEERKPPRLATVVVRTHLGKVFEQSFFKNKTKQKQTNEQTKTVRHLVCIQVLLSTFEKTLSSL